MNRYSFASDNYAGVHPEILRAVEAAAAGHAPAYGADAVSARCDELLRAHFGPATHSATVFTGTGANVVGLSLLLRRWQHVICAEGAHIDVDECGAPERALGVKLRSVPTPDGKLTPDLVLEAIADVGDQHRTQPGVVSLTQSTELGTVYTPDEVRALADLAHAHGLHLHLDGARLANAAAHLGLGLGEISTDCGVDVLSFGGTKNGALGAEVVIVTDPAQARELPFARKQAMQLGSKARVLAAQVVALLEGDLWHRNAAHANAMAERLARGVADVLPITRPRQANAVFARLTSSVEAELLEVAAFYPWDPRTGEVRWMCSWDTTEHEVDAFVAAIRAAVARAGA